MSERPEVRYADSDGVSIAYTRWGSGEQVLVYVAPWVSNVELSWDIAEFRRAYERAGKHVQVIEIDKRGVGLSDRTGTPPTPDDRVADTLAVLRAEGVERVSLLGASEAAGTATAVAARHPELVDSLMLVGPALPGVPPSTIRDHHLPTDPPLTGLELIREVMRSWGTDAAPFVRIFMPSGDGHARVLSWAQRFQRQSASPGALADHLASALTGDIVADLRQVTCPVMIGNSSGDLVVPVACARYLSTLVPTATTRIWDSPDHVSMFSPNWAEISDDIVEFVTGRRPAPVVNTRFAAIAFTDIVDSTATSSRIGDEAWKRLVQAHDAVTIRAVEEHGGRRVKSTGDGALAVFADPGRAIEALRSLREQIHHLGIEISTGLHAGQVHEHDDGDVTGIAVNLAARIEGVAAAGQIAVSRTITDLLLGSDHTFESLGLHELKGIDGDVEVFALAR